MSFQYILGIGQIFELVPSNIGGEIDTWELVFPLAATDAITLPQLCHFDEDTVATTIFDLNHHSQDSGWMTSVAFSTENGTFKGTAPATPRMPSPFVVKATNPGGTSFFVVTLEVIDTATPTSSPSVAPSLSMAPSAVPTTVPSKSSAPSSMPSEVPSSNPSVSMAPSRAPSNGFRFILQSTSFSY